MRILKLTKFANKIKLLLSKYPHTFNIAVVAVCCAASEISQQTFFQQGSTNRSLDVSSLYNYVFCATLTQGAPLTYWYKWLDSKYHGTTAKVISKKLFLDLGVLNPILLASFFTLLDIVERRNALENCRTKIIPTFLSSSVFWIPAQGINFLFVPSLYRVIYISVCSFAWIHILCYIKSVDLHGKK